MRARRIVLTAGAAIAAFLLLLAVFAVMGTRSTQNASGVADRGSPNIVEAIGGPFTMVDDEGKTVTEADFKGKPTVMFFGFTHCPDVCPTTLFELAGLMEKLGPEAGKLNYAFVSVDPERDTPGVLHDYIASFDPRIRGLTGTGEQMAKMAKEYRVFYEKVATDDGSYTMDHTATVYLMSPDNKLAGTIDFHESQDVALQKLKNLIAKA